MRNSGSEWAGFDGPSAPVKLRRKKKLDLHTRVDVSLLNRNEHNEAFRDALHNDEVAYQTRMALPHEWLNILADLSVMAPGMYLSDKVICNYLLNCWWALRFTPNARPIYLAF